MQPWPVAYTTLDEVRYKVFSAAYDNTKNSDAVPGTIIDVDREGIAVACKQGILKLITIQAPGKGPVKAADLARSRKDLFMVGKHFD